VQKEKYKKPYSLLSHLLQKRYWQQYIHVLNHLGNSVRSQKSTTGSRLTNQVPRIHVPFKPAKDD